MIVNRELKVQAKQIFKQHRIEFIVAAIAALMVSIISQIPSNMITIPVYIQQMNEIAMHGQVFTVADPTAQVAGMLAMIAIMAALYPVTVGYVKMALNGLNGHPVELNELGNHFRQLSRWALLFVLVFAKTFLWSLLLLIPGIIAAINYSQSVYLMLGDPDLKPNDAINQSIALMKGYRVDFFVLGLSFIGWLLLVVVTFGLAWLYVGPYMEITLAAFHRKLREINGAAIGDQPATVAPTL